MNMLVVMDASEERRMLRNALTTLGIEALEVTGADAAVEALEAGED
jgi:CheY-like chemotaxis protein